MIIPQFQIHKIPSWNGSALTFYASITDIKWKGFLDIRWKMFADEIISDNWRASVLCVSWRRIMNTKRTIGFHCTLSARCWLVTYKVQQLQPTPHQFRNTFHLLLISPPPGRKQLCSMHVELLPRIADKIIQHSFGFFLCIHAVKMFTYLGPWATSIGI